MEQREFRKRFLDDTEGWGAPLWKREHVVARHWRGGSTLEEAKSDLKQRLDTSLPLPDVALPPDPTAEAVLLAKIRWWVEETREQNWGQRTRPYKTIEEARPWLEGVWKHRQREDFSREHSERVWKLLEQIHAVQDELAELEDCRFYYGFESDQMLCWVPEEERRATDWTLDTLAEKAPGLGGSLVARVYTREVREITLGRGPSPYHSFAVGLREMAEDTGFSRFDLADLVLTGRQPYLPRVSFSRSSRSLGPDEKLHRHTYLTIRVNTRLTNEDWKDLGNRLRPLWRRGGPDDKRQRDLIARELLTLAVEAVGGPPTNKYSKRFWGEVVAPYLEERGYPGRTGHMALAMRYWRENPGNASSAGS